jgi:hypothetical protein
MPFAIALMLRPSFMHVLQGKPADRVVADTSDEESVLPDNPTDMDEEMIYPQKPAIRPLYDRAVAAGHHHQGGTQPAPARPLPQPRREGVPSEKGEPLTRPAAEVVKEAKEPQAAEGKVFPHGIGEERDSTTEGKEGPQGPDHVPYKNPDNMPPGINESFTAMEMEGWQEGKGGQGQGGASREEGEGCKGNVHSC